MKSHPLNPSAVCGVSACAPVELGQILSRVFLLQIHLSKFGQEVGQGTWTTAGLERMVTRQPTVVQVPCPSSPGNWTSGSARGKHVIKFVQVPCPSSCPSSGLGVARTKTVRPHTHGSQGKNTSKGELPPASFLGVNHTPFVPNQARSRKPSKIMQIMPCQKSHKKHASHRTREA